MNIINNQAILILSEGNLSASDSPKITLYKVDYDRSSNFKNSIQQMESPDTNSFRNMQDMRVKQIIVSDDGYKVVNSEKWSFPDEEALEKLLLPPLQKKDKKSRQIINFLSGILSTSKYEDAKIIKALHDLISASQCKDELETTPSLSHENLPIPPLPSSVVTAQADIAIQPVKGIFEEIVSRYDLNEIEKNFLNQKTCLMLSVKDKDTQSNSGINQARTSTITDIVNKYLEQRKVSGFSEMTSVEDAKVEAIFQKIIEEHSSLAESDRNNIEDNVYKTVDCIEKYHIFDFEEKDVEECNTLEDIQNLMVKFYERVIRDEIKEYLKNKLV